tara:strand:- start:921 stop:1250 length:330 start_codon:yes stop_codon:yes gene_type:complete
MKYSFYYKYHLNIKIFVLSDIFIYLCSTNKRILILKKMKMKKILIIGMLLSVAYYFRTQILALLMGLYWVILPDTTPPTIPSPNEDIGINKTEQLFNSDSLSTDTLNLQ